MEKNSKIYIAGHQGLVGSNILKVLTHKNYKKLITKDYQKLDLRNQKDTEKFFSKEKPEYLFLAAAKVGGILANSVYKAEFIYDNMMIATNIIHSAFKNNVKKLLNLGSSCIYPKFAPQPMNEKNLLTGILEPTNEPYAIAKIAAIKLCRYYNEQYGTNYISVMPTNLYGPNDNFNLETAHVLPSLMRKFHLAKLLQEKNYEQITKDFRKFPVGFDLDNTKLEKENQIDQFLQKLGISADAVVLWGTGEPFREFLYVEDLADACVYLMEKYDYKDVGEFVNIGTGNDIKIKELALLMSKTIGYAGTIQYDSSKPDGTPKKLLDVSRLNELGWKAKIPLEEGLKKMYEWYLKKN